VSERYGLNVTWEMVRASERPPSFFSCSLVECHLNGECLVAAAEGRVAGMRCECSHPVGESTAARDPFYGRQCQYHSKHGHCTGEETGHRDARSRCNGQPCHYLTSRYVRCDCRAGWEGRGCERRVGESEGREEHCSPRKVFNISVETVSGTGAGAGGLERELRAFWRSACNCSLVSLRTGPASLSLVVTGPEGEVRRTVRTISRSRRMTAGVRVAAVAIVSEVRPCVHRVELNQSNPLYRGREFSVSCFARGSAAMQFLWLRDGKLVNISVADRFMKEAVYHVQSGTMDRVAVLTVASARASDSGRLRCVVRDEGLGAARSLEPRLEVLRPPRVEVHPALLVLATGPEGRLVTPAQPLACYIAEDATLGSNHSFAWARQGEGGQHLALGPGDRVEELALPRGLLLRLGPAPAGGTYLCSVTISDQRTEAAVQVTVLPEAALARETCHPVEEAPAVWPRSPAGARYTLPCPEGSQGVMARECRGAATGGGAAYWAEPDSSACVREGLLAVERLFTEYRSGYTEAPGPGGPGRERLVLQLFSRLAGETEVSRRPTAAESRLMLSLLEGAARYLQDMDFSLQAAIGTRDRWQHQMLEVKAELYRVVSYLSSPWPGGREGERLVRVVQAAALGTAGGLEVGAREAQGYCPVLAFTARLPSGPPYSVLTKEAGYRAPQGTSAVQTGCGAVLAGAQVWLNSSGAGGPVRRVAVLFLAGLGPSLHLAGGPGGTRWRLASPALTVALEAEVPPRGSLRLGALAPEGLALTLRLPLSRPANLSQATAHCASLQPGPGPGQLAALLPSPHCTLLPPNSSLALHTSLTCRCSSTGTFALLLSRPPPGTTTRPPAPPAALLYGATAGLVLALLAGIGQLRSLLLLRPRLEGLLKLAACGAVSSVLLLLLLAGPRLLDPGQDTLRLLLLTALLAALSSHLALLLQAASSTLHLCRPGLLPRLLLSTALGFPLLLLVLLFLLHLLHSPSAKLQCALYTALCLLLLLGLLPLALLSLHHLHHHQLQTAPDSPKNEEILAKAGTIKRSLLTIALTLLLNIFTALYATHPDPLYELLLAFTTSLTGLSLLFNLSVSVGPERAWYTGPGPWGRELGRLPGARGSSSPGSSGATHSLQGSGSRSSRGRGRGGAGGEGAAGGERGEQVGPGSGDRWGPRRQAACWPPAVTPAASAGAASGCCRCTDTCRDRGGSRTPVRAKCLLRDDRSPALPSPGGPETLEEVIERVRPGQEELLRQAADIVDRSLQLPPAPPPPPPASPPRGGRPLLAAPSP
jgi:hypothetical protein